MLEGRLANEGNNLEIDQLQVLSHTPVVQMVGTSCGSRKQKEKL